jgi:hypothetical protein
MVLTYYTGTDLMWSFFAACATGPNYIENIVLCRQRPFVADKVVAHREWRWTRVREFASLSEIQVVVVPTGARIEHW